MIETRMRVVGMKGVIKRLETWKKRLEDLKWLAEAFEDYTMEKRVPSMFRHGGRVPGRYGKDYTRWKPNTAWVRRAKGDKRVFFKHGRRVSSVEKSLNFSSHVTRGKVTFRLRSTHRAKKYLQRGHRGFRVPKRGTTLLAIPYGFGQTVFAMHAKVGPMAPRPFEGFRQGDVNWVKQFCERNALKVGRVY